MIGVRVHGRGGQGAVTFAHILSVAATFEGKYGQSSQAPTIERRGAPTQGYARIGHKKIAERGLIAHPDYVVVIDSTIIPGVDVETGMSENGMIVANALKKLELRHNCIFFDATSIALDIFKRPVTNTVMLGGFVAATELVTLDSVKEGVRFMFRNKMDDHTIDLNIEAISRAYEEVKNGR